jgi:hypothetical protein
MIVRATLVLLSVVAMSDVAQAQSLRRGACGPDIQTYCGKPGKGKLRACLAEHRAQLSPACKIAIADAWLERASRRGAGAKGDE